MLELLLNTVKILTARDTREGVSSLMDLVRRSPEWKKDLCNIEARVPLLSREQAVYLSDICEEKLRSLSFPIEAISAFTATYAEVTANAFEHGCKRDLDKVGLTIDLTPSYVALTVTNPPKGPKFTLPDFSRESSTPEHPKSRGRGLRLVYRRADEVLGLPKQNGVKATIYKSRVSLSAYSYGEVLVIRIRDIEAARNPSLARRLYDFVRRHLENALIIDFSVHVAVVSDDFGFEEPKTRVVREIVRISNEQELVKRELGVLSKAESSSLVMLFLGYRGYDLPEILDLPDSMLATSWQEACEKIGHPELSERLSGLHD